MSIFEQIKPPKKADKNLLTYPIGEAREVGSSVIKAAAVLAEMSEEEEDELESNFLIEDVDDDDFGDGEDFGDEDYNN